MDAERSYHEHALVILEKLYSEVSFHVPFYLRLLIYKYFLLMYYKYSQNIYLFEAFPVLVILCFCCVLLELDAPGEAIERVSSHARTKRWI